MRFAFIVALLAVCAATPGSSEDNLAAYFPIDTGRTWRYETVKNSTISLGAESRKYDKLGTVTDEVLGPSNEGTVAIKRIVTERWPSMEPVRLEVIRHVSVTPEAIAIVAIESPGQTRQTLPTPEALLLSELPGPTVQGEIGTLRSTIRLSSQSASQTETPSGAFSDCLLTETTGSLSGVLNGVPLDEGSVVVSAWYARGVGLVRETRTLQFTATAPNGDRIHARETATKVLVESSRP